MTHAERNELLDAVEAVERELEAHNPVDPAASMRPLVVTLADLVARAVRVWITSAGDSVTSA